MLKKMLRQVTENRKPVCYSFQTQLARRQTAYPNLVMLC
jgi:hypothetical protein